MWHSICCKDICAVLRCLIAKNGCLFEREKIKCLRQKHIPKPSLRTRETQSCPTGAALSLTDRVFRYF